MPQFQNVAQFTGEDTPALGTPADAVVKEKPIDPNAPIAFRPPMAAPTLPDPDPISQEQEKRIRADKEAGELFPGLGGPIVPLMGASLRQNNSMVSVLAAVEQRLNSTRTEGYNPLDDIQGTRFYDQYLDRFIPSQSSRDTYAIIAQIQQEEADRKQIHDAGPAGWATDTAAQIADPLLLFPSGMAVDTLKATNYARAALKVGVATLPATTAQELALQASQQTRPLKESMVNIASGTLLTALVGGAAVRGMSRLERIGATAAVERERLLMNQHADNPIIDKGEPVQPAPGAPGEQAPAPMPAPVGAAAADTRIIEKAPIAGQHTAEALTQMLEQVPGIGSVAGKSARWVADKLGSLNPIDRILNSGSDSAKRAMADLAEIVPRLKQNLQGIATTQFGGPALSRIVQNQIIIKTHQLNQQLTDAWKELNWGSPEAAPWFAKERDVFSDAAARPDDKPTFEQFKAEVSRAMRRNDQHEIPQVAQSAKWIRDNIITPAKDAAIQAGLLPKDVEAKFAESYLQRVYNVQKLEAERPFFVNRVADYLKGDQQKKAAAQDRLAGYNNNLTAIKLRMAQMQSALERHNATEGKLITRLDEAGKPVTRGEARTAELQEKATQYEEEISEIEDFIRSQRDVLTDPQQRAELENMQRDVTELRRQDRPMTEAQLKALEDEEVKGALTGTNRMAAEMLVGRRKIAKPPSFLNWLIANGGFHDRGGDVASTVGGKDIVPGLINPRGRAFDQMGEKIQNEFPGSFPTTETTGHGAPEANDILNWISDSTRGHEPDWWVHELGPEDQQKLEAGKMAGAMDELFNRAGVQVKSVKDVGKILRDEFSQSVTLRDLDKLAAEMEGAGESVPVSIYRRGKEDELRIAREDVQRMRDLIRQGQAGIAARQARLGNTEIRAGEAAFAEKQARGRFGVLVDRLDRHEQRGNLLRRALENAQEYHDDIRDRMEEELLQWQGKSAAGAKAAMKARAAGAAEREPTGRRLTGADDAVDADVRSIIQSHRDLSDDELRTHANQLADRIIGSPNGRLNYDMDDGGPKIGYGKSNYQENTEARGPLMARTNAMPDDVLEPWLENDIQRVMASHMRTMIPDTLIASHFGDVEMSEAFRKIDDEYAAKHDAARADPVEQTRIAQERKTTIGDLADLRDMVRGVFAYPYLKQSPFAGRAAAAAKNYNVLVNMGMSMFSSLQDMAGPMMRWGMLTVMRDAYIPFLNSLMTNREFSREATRQLQLMGIGLETDKAARWHGLNDTLQPFHPRSQFERTLQWSADQYQWADGLGPWTDVMKRIAGVTAMRNLGDMAERFSLGTHSERDLAILGENNINRNLAERITEQYKAHSNDVDGIALANTGEWTDAEARRAFEGAIQRDVDIGVVTPGLERPTLMSKPIMSVLTQFKSYTAGSHQRILISNLQRMDAQVMSGVMFSMGVGMLQYAVSKAISGEPTSDNPADWIKEAISRGNMLGWFEEGNQFASKATRGQLDVYRLLGSSKPLSRYAGRSVMDQLLGPTAGKLESLFQVTGAGATAIASSLGANVKNDWGESDTHALRRLTAFQNLFYLRRGFDAIEEGVNNSLGIPMKQRGGGGIQLP